MTWIVARWREHYPDAEIILAPDDGLDPFNKSMAVNTAAAQATGDMFFILDADSWVDQRQVFTAMRLIEDGRAPWVVPANTSLRLTKEATARMLKLGPGDPLPKIQIADIEQQSYVVGFMHIVSRTAFEEVGGMDERFRGWGGEDGAFTRAMDNVIGRHAKLQGPVVSLWHSRPRNHVGQRIWLGQESRTANNSLWRRYTRANRRDKVLRVLAEPGGPLASTRHRRVLNIEGEAEQMAVTFKSPVYPALMVKTVGRKFKFVGGRLRVDETDAKTSVRSRTPTPLYRLTAIARPPSVTVLVPVPPVVDVVDEPAPEMPKPRKRKRGGDTTSTYTVDVTEYGDAEPVVIEVPDDVPDGDDLYS
jgi:hypothetical protein